MTDEHTHRTGVVALSGRPNAGKSTLLNALLGQEVSLVSPKPETTRNRIVGIHNLPGAQIVFVDTPGLRTGRTELNRRMQRGARQAMSEADLVVWVVDATRLSASEPAVGAAAKGDDIEAAEKATVVALNKVDLVRPKQLLLPLIERMAALPGVVAVVPLSALRRDGLDQLLQEISGRLPEGPPLYPEDMVTDRPERFLASELVRGAVLRWTRQEVPHASAVVIESWRESERGCHLEATVFVERVSQRAILIGKGGEMIKKIGSSARADIARVLGCPVHLSLQVTVAEDWRGDPKTLRDLGYDE